MQLILVSEATIAQEQASNDSGCRGTVPTSWFEIYISSLLFGIFTKRERGGIDTFLPNLED